MYGIHGLTPKHCCSPEGLVLIFLSLQLSWGLVNLTPAQYTIGSNTMRTFYLGVMPIGALLGGYLAQAFGQWPALVLGACGFLLPVVWLWFSPVRIGKLVET